MNPVSLVNDLTHEMMSPGQLSSMARLTLKSLYIGHLGWWLYRKKKLYSDTNNTFALACGNLFNWTIGDGMIRTGAKLLLIITRIEECKEQFLALGRDFTKLANCFKGRYSVVLKPKWHKSNKLSLISPTSKNGWKSKKKRLVAFSMRLYECIIKIFKRIGKVGMHMWDAYDAFFVTNEAMNEVFVNGIKWMDKLNGNKDYFIQKLASNKPLINKVLSGMNVRDLTAEQVVESVTKTLDITEKGVQVVHKVTNAGNKFLVNFAKNCLTNLAATFGQLHKLPGSALPPEELEWESKPKEQQEERYANVKWVIPEEKHVKAEMYEEQLALLKKKRQNHEYHPSDFKKIDMLDPFELTDLQLKLSKLMLAN